MDINGWISHWLWRWSISIHRNFVGEHRGGLTYRGLWGKGELLEVLVHWKLWEIVEGSLWKWIFSFYGLSAMGAWRRGLLYWGPWRLGRGRHLWWASLSIGAQVGNWRGAHVQGTLRDRWRLCRKGSGNGHLLHRNPTWESGRGLIYKGLREIDEGSSRNGASPSEGAVWSKPGGGLLYWEPQRIC